MERSRDQGKMARLETVRDLVLLLGEGIYDDFNVLHLRGDLLFDLCALPRTSPLLAAEKVKKRRFSRNALKVAFELIILKRYCWYPQCKLVLESGMNSTDRCLGDVYDLKAMGREQQGLQLKRALEALHLFSEPLSFTSALLCSLLYS